MIITYKEAPEGYVTISEVLDNRELNPYNLDRPCVISRLKKKGIPHHKLDKCGTGAFKHNIANLYKLEDVLPYLYPKKQFLIDSPYADKTARGLDLKMAKAFIRSEFHVLNHIS